MEVMSMVICWMRDFKTLFTVIINLEMIGFDETRISFKNVAIATAPRRRLTRIDGQSFWQYIGSLSIPGNQRVQREKLTTLKLIADFHGCHVKNSSASVKVQEKRPPNSTPSGALR
ncbi:hypothetical protein GHT06_017313 [Daphnia sinensis]|uniref:Uncharacterized protein n=1 Tax=Daphnia sinensis TaxID=1820382 RepID=A0AAD5L7A1_9CRUS|nr:hypothetical protein GHT06_017313 [Daphnia sinensis]